MLHRAVVFHIHGELPFEARMLMENFRLAVNCAIRAGLQAKVTSRNALVKLAYKDFRKEHPNIYSQHLVSSFEVACSVLKNLRRHWEKGPVRRIPYARRLMMKAENQAYKLDRENGVVDLPIRAGCHVKLRLVLSDYHRIFLNDKSLSFGSLTLLPDRVIIAFRKSAPRPYTPETALSLDTNERSLDGVFLGENECLPIQAAYPDVPIIQARHHDRRRSLQKRKAHDQRTSRRLCRREGKREHHRIEYRMHQVANAVLGFAEEHKSTIVLEDLNGMAARKRGKSLNRRLSSWPRRKLHSIIEYKAAWNGVPIIKIDPYNSSRRCPICGRVRYSRMGAEFECECGWRADRHVNAGINLLQTAFPNGMAGGLRFSPGAFQHDVVMTLYDPSMGARLELNGTSRSVVRS
ncbi:MAG: IS200/IS605 family element transposase accessory protein TnpB [Thermoplasmata archaeon]|nr:IS200/IS605 family element transposase accessory protein TnpB [Thermoplasmata archaeon]